MSFSIKKYSQDFKRLIANGNLSHAYLFFGGDEKTRQEKFVFALSLANFLENGVFEEPVKLLRETLIISLDDPVQPEKKRTIGIDEIRLLKYFLWQKPINSFRRVAIIKEAENLTFEAQNACLKIVEEPPESSLIVFIAKSEDSLFPTLNSRLQKIYFPKTQTNTGYTRTNTDDIWTSTDGPYKSTPSQHKSASSSRQSVFASHTRINTSSLCEFALSEAEIDQFFENLINDLKKDPVKKSQQLKEILKRLTLIKQFNTNKRLQLRALISKIAT